MENLGKLSVRLKQTLWLVLFVLSSSVMAQVPFHELPGTEIPEGIRVPAAIRGGDTIMHVYLRAITVRPPYVFKNVIEEFRYSRLARNVKKVYPYSQLIKLTFIQIAQHYDSLPTKRAKEQYIDIAEKDLRKKFEGELVKLSMNQGRILLKLVDRETGVTTYTILKEWKGTIQAFFWQSLAMVFGSNLKAEYDPVGDDAMIEDIVIRIENGQL